MKPELSQLVLDIDKFIRDVANGDCPAVTIESDCWYNFECLACIEATARSLLDRIEKKNNGQV